MGGWERVENNLEWGDEECWDGIDNCVPVI